MLASPTIPSHPHTLSSQLHRHPGSLPLSYSQQQLPRPRPPPRQPRRRSPPSLHKQAALNASLRYMELEKARRREEQEQQEAEAQREYQRRQALEAEWAEENQQVSIIVTSWDDDKKCWYPIEACGPVSRELRMFIERRKAMASKAAGR